MSDNRPPMARASAPNLPAVAFAEVIEPNALGQIVQSEINQQIATARRFPRDITSFVRQSSGLVTMNEAVALECFYVLKRKNREGGSNDIEGPSARFAEIISNTFGNIRSGARIIAEDKTHVVAQGFFHDLEKNTAITIEVRRRITTSKGERYSEDMVNVTCQAALAIAMRNAVLKGIPKAFWWPVYAEARRCAIGNVETLAKRRVDLLTYFGKLGVKPEQVYAYLNVKGIESITVDHLIELGGIANAIKEGETTVEDEFPPVKIVKAEPKKEEPKTDGTKKEPEKKAAEKEPEPQTAPAEEEPPPPEEEPATSSAADRTEQAEDDGRSGQPAPIDTEW